ncbi:protein ImuA [Primorskyibacter sedentarius]|uniref:Protein ImuA n=2 Tax=Primorskyibacter sedentarius TaxID=745311 RepID=A0A4R3JQ29_9RHOB|nr:protein ImuA [Primorskyibacter sedentarius]
MGRSMQSDQITTDFPAVFPLRGHRTHEVCGPGAAGFAAACFAAVEGPVLWAVEDWRQDGLNPVALSEFRDPGQLLTARCKTQTDVLAVAEEGLRDGALGLVVAEISQPIGLTEGRRLQLAATAGKTPGLLIVPEGMGSNAAETRWRCAPYFDRQDSTLLRWSLIKNKKGTLVDWVVRWDVASRRIIVVSKVRE